VRPLALNERIWCWAWERSSFTEDANGALGLPFPVDQASDVPGRDGGLRIFSYTDAMPACVFLPALVLLFGLLILAALYAGSPPPAPWAPERLHSAPPGER
jgi:hypothetical protein